MKHNLPVHFIGIGGIGMSGIARLLLQKGIPVSGSDARRSAITDDLESLGATIYVGHRAENVHGVGAIVISSAIRKDNPEMVEAQRLGIAIRHRSDQLADLVNADRGVSVAGTHGKTTTSGMVATMLHHAGVSPSYVVGGISNELGDNARAGSSPWFVIEADESDGTLVKYHPEVAILTNAELDHPDFYHSVEQLDGVYRTYLSNVRAGGLGILCADDVDVRRIAATVPALSKLWYGFSPEAELRAVDLDNQRTGASYTAVMHGETLGRVNLRVFGRHNVSNSLAALAVGLRAGLSFDQVSAALGTFTGMQRRFQVVASSSSLRVVDDYAHHPSEVRATLSAARNTRPGRIISVFQPHRYSRTATLAREFGEAFGDADEVVLTDVYGAGEDPIPGVSSDLILASLEACCHPSAHLVHGLDNVEKFVADRVRPDDLVITMGAGDIWKVAHSLGRKLVETNV